MKEAEKLWLQVMEARRRLLGVDHPDTLWSMANLACTYESQGRLKEAEDLKLQVDEGRKYSEPATTLKFVQETCGRTKINGIPGRH